MSFDVTESIRREQQQAINAEGLDRAALEAKHGQVWSTDELREEFEVEGFAAPLVVVKRKSDGQRGTLYFQHHERFYFSFSEHK